MFNIYLLFKMKLLFPGNFSIWTDGHDSIVRKCLKIKDVEKIHIIVSNKERDGISPELSFDFIYALYKNNPKVEVSISEDASPIKTCYGIVNNASKGTFALVSSDKGKDYERCEQFVEAFSEKGKYHNPRVEVINCPIKVDALCYTNRVDRYNHTPVSASVARRDVKMKDYEAFKTNYKKILEEYGISENKIRTFFTKLLDQIKMDAISKHSIHESLKRQYGNELTYDQLLEAFDFDKGNEEFIDVESISNVYKVRQSFITWMKMCRDVMLEFFPDADMDRFSRMIYSVSDGKLIIQWYNRVEENHPYFNLDWDELIQKNNRREKIYKIINVDCGPHYLLKGLTDEGIRLWSESIEGEVVPKLNEVINQWINNRDTWYESADEMRREKKLNALNEAFDFDSEEDIIDPQIEDIKKYGILKKFLKEPKNIRDVNFDKIFMFNTNTKNCYLGLKNPYGLVFSNIDDQSAIAFSDRITELMKNQIKENIEEQNKKYNRKYTRRLFANFPDFSYSNLDLETKNEVIKCWKRFVGFLMRNFKIKWEDIWLQISINGKDYFIEDFS